MSDTKVELGLVLAGQEDIKREFQESLTRLKNNFFKDINVAKERFTSEFEILNNGIENISKSRHYAAVLNSVNTISKAALDAKKGIKSGDPQAITTFVLSTVGTLAPFLPPPAGPLISTICAIASTLVGFFMEDGTENDMLKMITKALENQYARELQDKGAGLETVYRNTMIYLKHHENDEHLTESAINKIDVYIKNDFCLEYLGAVKSFIERKAATERIEKDEANNVLMVLDMYCNVSFLRNMIMNSKRTLIYKHNPKNSTIEAIREAEYTEMIADAKLLESILRQPSKPSTAVLASVYNPAKYKSIKTYMKKIGVPGPPHLLKDTEPFYLTVEEWPKWAVRNNLVTGYKLIAVQIPDFDAKTTFHQVGKTEYWSNDFFDEGEFGHVKLILTKSGKCLISTKKYPDHFCFLNYEVGKLSHIKEYQGDPLAQGYFKLGLRYDPYQVPKMEEAENPEGSSKKWWRKTGFPTLIGFSIGFILGVCISFLVMYILTDCF